mmetsp:Transcript_6088/g.10476  ORF Transcript_6088/g.10476 Transcript_6088/m.10476 type:complete len:271 (+) Transcript_6088:304-1116(+)
MYNTRLTMMDSPALQGAGAGSLGSNDFLCNILSTSSSANPVMAAMVLVSRPCLSDARTTCASVLSTAAAAFALAGCTFTSGVVRSALPIFTAMENSLPSSAGTCSSLIRTSARTASWSRQPSEAMSIHSKRKRALPFLDTATLLPGLLKSMAWSNSGIHASCSSKASETTIGLALPMRSSALIWSSSKTWMFIFWSRSNTTKSCQSVSFHLGFKFFITVLDCQVSPASSTFTYGSLVALLSKCMSAPMRSSASRAVNRRMPRGTGRLISA